jgi:peptidoglycan biosynthesis protein MviN/MurJ (putative lipid II flippase)
MILAFRSSLECLDRPMRFACATCKRTGAVALVISGSIVLALAGVYLAYAAVGDWNHGWTARIIGVSLFCTAPGVVALVIDDFRSTRIDVSLTARLARIGIALLCFGALEFVLAFAALIYWSVITPGAMF